MSECFIDANYIKCGTIEVLKKGSFEYALKHLKDGNKVTKKSWHKEGMYIKMQVPDEYSKMRGKYLYITIGDYINPWHPSQADMLEEDWEVVE